MDGSAYCRKKRIPFSQSSSTCGKTTCAPPAIKKLLQHIKFVLRIERMHIYTQSPYNATNASTKGGFTVTKVTFCFLDCETPSRNCLYLIILRAPMSLQHPCARHTDTICSAENSFTKNLSFLYRAPAAPILQFPPSIRAFRPPAIFAVC